MDIVYTLRNHYDGEELRYSLRSLKNIPHDKVFFVGGCPRWAKNIIHIPTEQTGTKWENSLNNIRTACKDERLSANFILMNDDFFILDRIADPVEELNLYMGTLRRQAEKLEERSNCPTNYLQGIKGTIEFLQGLGVAEPLSYEMHAPFVFNKHKVLKLFELDGINTVECLQIRSLYGNLYLAGGIDSTDVKYTLNSGFLPKELGKFLSCDDAVFCQLAKVLLTKFPNKSVYEI